MPNYSGLHKQIYLSLSLTLLLLVLTMVGCVVLVTFRRRIFEAKPNHV